MMNHRNSNDRKTLQPLAKAFVVRKLSASMPKLYPLSIILLLPCMLSANLPIAPGASLQKAADGFSFTEGPAALANGSVYFTDQPNDRILLWCVESGAVSTWLEPCGRSNGLYLDSKGKLIACADENGELWSIDPETKQVTVLTAGFDGGILNGPNDVWEHPRYGYYFTDPFYKRPYWVDREQPDQTAERVYFLPHGSSRALVVDENLNKPNGIIGSPCGTRLFVADIGAGKTYVYTIAPDGSLTDRMLFCELGSDGMTLDAQGNLYLTGQGVTVFDKEGQLLGNIPVQEHWTSNVTFAGKDRKTLFITAMGAIYTLEMAVVGAAGE
jgi:gluconolactonase